MARKWSILRAAVEQEIAFPSREVFDAYIAGLDRKGEPYQVGSVSEHADGTLTVLMRKRYNPGNAFLEKAPAEPFTCAKCNKRPKDVEWGMCHVLCRQTHKDDFCSFGQARED